MRALTHHPDVLQRLHAIGEQVGVTPGLAKALLQLSADRPVPMRDLAKALKCDTSYVTAVVDGLEEHQLAERLPHPTDRRIKMVALTERGAQVAGLARAALDEPPLGFERLSEADAAALLELLRKVAPTSDLAARS